MQYGDFLAPLACIEEALRPLPPTCHIFLFDNQHDEDNEKHNENDNYAPRPNLGPPHEPKGTQKRPQPALGQLLVALEPLLTALWPLLAALGPLLGRSCSALGRSWAALGCSWGDLGTTRKYHSKIDSKNDRFGLQKGCPKGVKIEPKTNKNRRQKSKTKIDAKKKTIFKIVLRLSWGDLGTFCGRPWAHFYVFSIGF